MDEIDSDLRLNLELASEMLKNLAEGLGRKEVTLEFVKETHKSLIVSAEALGMVLVEQLVRNRSKGN